MESPSNRRRTYLLVILALIFATNHLDQKIIALGLQDIKREFDVSDTQLGLLTGIAYALFYSVMGIPIARWADRGDRVRILAICTFLWSAAVALCGAAANFVQLLTVRVLVAVGEAGNMPCSHSLIASNYERKERPRAVSFFMLGGPVATLLGFLGGGWVIQHYGWRTALLLVSAPGLVLAVLAALTLADPRRQIRHTQTGAVQEDEKIQSFWKVTKALYSNLTFRYLLLAFSVMSFFGYGIQNWQPAFFIRSHGLQPVEIGAWFSAIFGISGLIGIYTGGELASRLAPKNEGLQLKGMALAYGFLGIVSTAVYLVADHRLAFALLAIATFGGFMATAPLFATVQAIVPERMRAQAIALIYLVANLVGLGLGPLAAGVVSDLLRGIAAEDSLKYALVLFSPGYCVGAWFLWRAHRTVRLSLLSADPDTLESPSRMTVGGQAGLGL